jgi:hypothetical protein
VTVAADVGFITPGVIEVKGIGPEVPLFIHAGVSLSELYPAMLIFAMFFIFFCDKRNGVPV